MAPRLALRLHSVSLSGDRHHRKKPKSDKVALLRNKSPELRT